MIVVLRNVEKASAHWEARTDVDIERHRNLPQFHEHEVIAPHATRAIQSLGVWVGSHLPEGT